MRQGDPLSPYLFLLAIETLAISIRENPEIDGIKIGKNEIKLLQYADDTTAVLSNLNSAITLFQHLNLFKNVCGLEVNSSKTEGMWIGFLKSNEEKPLGINWPSEPIKALGMFFTYDQTPLYEKNFRDKLDKMKKLTNIWSSRGLSIYGKVTIIKSLLIPKLVYASSLLPTPANIIKQVEHIIYTFLWKGKDKVTRLSAINNFEGGGIKMIHIDSMVKALRLAWFECNYTMKDLSIISIFYRELLQWWSEFRDHVSDEKYWLTIIWNHKDIRINGKPVFYKTYYNSGIYTVNDLLLNLDNVKSFEAIRNKIEKVNFLTWTGLRHSVPSNLKTLQYRFTKGNPSFIYKNDIFDITKVKSKDYYSLMISKKAQVPNNVQKLKRYFNSTEEDLKLAFTLPHIITYEPYVKAFQYKILNWILYTNTKLFKIGYSEHDKCSFCSNESETLHHLFFYCPYANLFWKALKNAILLYRNDLKF